jgi:hypothetical protein
MKTELLEGMCREIKRPIKQMQAAATMPQCSNACANIDDKMQQINVTGGVRREQFSNYLK